MLNGSKATILSFLIDLKLLLDHIRAVKMHFCLKQQCLDNFYYRKLETKHLGNSSMSRLLISTPKPLTWRMIIISTSPTVSCQTLWPNLQEPTHIWKWTSFLSAFRTATLQLSLIQLSEKLTSAKQRDILDLETTRKPSRLLRLELPRILTILRWKKCSQKCKSKPS
jgi:hypothetical protein